MKLLLTVLILGATLPAFYRALYRAIARCGLLGYRRAVVPKAFLQIYNDAPTICALLAAAARERQEALA